MNTSMDFTCKQQKNVSEVLYRDKVNFILRILTKERERERKKEIRYTFLNKFSLTYIANMLG